MRNKPLLITAGLALATAGISAGGVYAWQQARLDETRDGLEQAVAEAQQVENEKEGLLKDVSELRERVDALRKRRVAAEGDARRMQECLASISRTDSEGLRTVAFGYPHVPDDSRRELLVDAAQWFSGPEANEAAAADGVIEPGESVPNDYYIRNEDRSRAAIRVADDLVIVLSTADRESIPSPRCMTWGAFQKAMRDPRPWERSLNQSPYWLTTRDGQIIRIVEQYLP